VKRIKLLSVCLLVALLALACVPTSMPTVTPTPTNTPTPTPTPTPSVIRVEVDGSGHYATLEEAVAGAPEGVPIELGAGTFHLEEPLEVRRPITLRGAGMEKTEIVSDAEGYVVRFVRDGPFVVEDITFRHEGREVAAVVLVRGGEVAFTRCRFTGAVYDEDRDAGGGGLYFKEDAAGIVQDCEFVENTVGIFVADRSEPKLEGNAVTDNDGFGITYRDNAGGVARGNDCSWNNIGIGVLWRAQPTLEENTCTNNTYYGILYRGNTSGTARHNECSGNGEVGITVIERARPTLEENVCEDNGVVGIYYTDEAGGVARENECSGNMYGIYVEATANPELIDNDCHDNSEVDIVDDR
jgi:parallel beta-helix repeat protein